jgi:putative hydrolase of HD superfamily
MRRNKSKISKSIKKSIIGNEERDLNQIADFLFEVGQLQNTPRSFYNFLGYGEQSVAEHLHRAAAIAFVLAQMAKLDPYRTASMALFHDIGESRISDLNYVNQKYNTRLEDKAHSEIFASFPFGESIKVLIDEYHTRETYESKLVKDADNLEFILSLKEQVDLGSERARSWIPSAKARLKTEEGKKLVEVILKTKSDRWWFGNPTDSWWVDRSQDKNKK